MQGTKREMEEERDEREEKVIEMKVNREKRRRKMRLTNSNLKGIYDSNSECWKLGDPSTLVDLHGVRDRGR